MRCPWSSLRGAPHVAVGVTRDMKRLLGVGLATAFAVATLGGPTLAKGPDMANGSGVMTDLGYSIDFAMHARSLKDGSARGLYTQTNPVWGATADITVDCLDVDGDIAYLGGTVTKATNHYSWALGKDVVFAVKDAGEGKGVVDLVSYWLSSASYDCHTPYAQSVTRYWLASTSRRNDVTDGNIQVVDR